MACQATHGPHGKRATPIGLLEIDTSSRKTEISRPRIGCVVETLAKRALGCILAFALDRSGAHGPGWRIIPPANIAQDGSGVSLLLDGWLWSAGSYGLGWPLSMGLLFVSCCNVVTTFLRYLSCESNP
jgi:hypothetical protein